MRRERPDRNERAEAEGVFQESPQRAGKARQAQEANPSMQPA